MRRLFAFAVALTAMTGIAIGGPPSDSPNNNANAAKQDAKDTAKASKDAAKDTAKESKDAAKDTAKESKDTAKDSTKASKEAAKDTSAAAKDTAKSEKDAAKDSTKSTSDSAKDSAKSASDSAKNTANDASKSASDSAKSANKSASDTAKSAEKNASNTTKTAAEVGDDAADSARDTADDARDNARDARDSARDTARDARDTARDARSSARDAGRSAREGARDTARDARDSARSTRDSARDTRDRTRDDARDARDSRDSRDARSTDRRDRRDSRDTARADRRDNHRSVEQLGLEFGRVTDRGLTVSTIERDSVAYRAGLRDDDIIISIGGHDLRSARDFDRYLYAGDRNERIEIVVWRDGREEVVYFEPDVIYTDDVDTVQTSYAYDVDRFGVVLDDSYDDRIVVVKVLPNTPAYTAGLRAGDVITTWHGEPVSSRRDFVRVIERAEPGTVNFEYQRNDRTVRADANLRRDTFRNERQADRAERRVSRDANRATDIRTGEQVRQPAPGTTAPERRVDRQQDRREGTRPAVPGGGLLPRNR